MRRINYKSDIPPFLLSLKVDENQITVPDCDFIVRFYIEGYEGRHYDCSHIGGVWSNCEPSEDGTKLVCYINNQRLGIGELCAEFHYISPDRRYSDGSQKSVVVIGSTELGVELVEDNGDAVTEAVIDVTLPFIYRTAYEIARDHGYTGTAEDFYGALASVVGIADAEKKRVTAEITRNANEQERIENEENRLNAESERVNAEAQRVRNEAIRGDAESDRVEQEEDRKAKFEEITGFIATVRANEGNRESNELERQTNEDTRITEEAKRVEAEKKRAAEFEQQKLDLSGKIDRSGDEMGGDLIFTDNAGVSFRTSDGGAHTMFNDTDDVAKFTTDNGDIFEFTQNETPNKNSSSLVVSANLYNALDMTLDSMGSALDGDAAYRAEAGDKIFNPDTCKIQRYNSTVGGFEDLCDPIDGKLYANKMTDYIYRWNTKAKKMVFVGGVKAYTKDEADSRFAKLDDATQRVKVKELDAYNFINTNSMWIGDEGLLLGGDGNGHLTVDQDEVITDVTLNEKLATKADDVAYGVEWNNGQPTGEAQETTVMDATKNTTALALILGQSYNALEQEVEKKADKTELDTINANVDQKVSKTDIVQNTGQSTTSVMSQKAVSDELSEVGGKVDELEVWKGNNVPVYTLGVVNGWVEADGTLTPGTERAHTFIPIGGFGTDDILTIIISTSYGTMLNWYDNNHQFISNIGSWVTSSKSISLKNKPTNAEYICLSYKIAERDNMRIYGGLQAHIDSISEISNEISIKNRAYLHTEKNDGNYVSYLSGSLNAHASYNVYKIYCGEGDRLIYPQFYGDAAGMAFYDAADNFITGNALNGVIGSITTHIVPDKCSYALISCFVVNDSQFSVAYEKGNGGSRVYEDFSVKNETIDNKAVSIIKTDFIEHDDETNLISEWHDNKYINANGVETSFDGLYATGKVYFKPNTPYYWSSLINGYYAFYKKDGTVIEAHPNESNTLANPFTIPTDCAYGRFTAPNMTSVKQIAYIATKDFNSIIPSFNPVPSPSTNILDPSIRVIGDKANYLDDDFSIFNRGLCIGDSLTQGTFNSNTPTSTGDTYNADAPSDTPHWGNYSYPKYLSKISGCEIVNWGIGGDTSDEWWIHRTTQGVYYKGDAEWTGFDFAIIQLGVNDTIRRTNWSDITETAFNNIIAKLKESNKGIKIFVATIIPANKYYNLNFIAFSQSIRDYVAKLKDDDVILIDIAKYGHTNDDVAYNCGHLSAYGYLRLAMDYKALIGSYINDNKGKFRYIQFAGTELNYIDK